MKPYRLSAEAERDYFEAFEYLAERNPKAADKWGSRMIETFDGLAEWPLTGRIRPEYAPPNLRCWIEGDYAVIYDPFSDPLHIIALLHGAQDIPSLMARQSEAGDDES